MVSNIIVLASSPEEALVMIDGYLNENTHTVRIGKKRRYSDEQRAKMAERLKIAREKK